MRFRTAKVGNGDRDLPTVLTRCLVSGEVVETHAVMTAAQLERFKSELHFWCPSCRAPHHRTKGEVWLEDQIRCEAATATQLQNATSATSAAIFCQETGPTLSRR